MSDKELIKKIKKSNEKAIEKCIDKYKSYVAAVIYSVGYTVLTSQDIEEIMSDVFFVIWQKRGDLLVTDSLKPYLGEIARNKTKNKLRAIKWNESLNDEIENQQGKDMEEFYLIKEEISTIRHILEKMKSPDKELMEAYYFENYKLSEIASIFSIPISTVKTKIYRGKAALIQELEERGFVNEN